MQTFTRLLKSHSRANYIPTSSVSKGEVTEIVLISVFENWNNSKISGDLHTNDAEFKLLKRQ